MPLFDSVLVANRGEVALRVIRTLRRLGIRSLAVYSEADAELPFVAAADRSALLGPPPPAESYLDSARIVRAALELGAEAIHPGYGFLSENARFAAEVLDAGLAWIGPSPDVIEAMGDKINARNAMAKAGVPVAPGTPEPLFELGEALEAAALIDYPLMVKAAAGGGGMGMTLAEDDDSLAQAFATAQGRSERLFGSRAILIERYVEHARHVEVQLLGTAAGEMLALGERDCSVQRRHQKVAEETPSPALGDELRAHILAAGAAAGRAVDYRGAGTAEFLLDLDSGSFTFLEMNTRLQVEHPITELVTGVDIVEEQLRIAAGEPVGAAASSPHSQGHAIEFRIYAEDPVRFFPSPGRITAWQEPEGDGIRVDGGYQLGNTVTPHYDPLLAKLCVRAPDREQALARIAAAAADFVVSGPRTNLPFLDELLENDEFAGGAYDTRLIDRMRSASATH
jgi:acetyl-CoA carboxylase biotin carboxylase subunit